MAKSRKHNKSHRKFNSKKIAKGLGAVAVIRLKLQTDEQGREFFEFDIIAGDGDQTRRIYKLSENELDKYKLIAEPEGQFFTHCLHVCRNVKNFHNRVTGFRELPPTHKGMKLRVQFYEKA